MVLGWCGSSWTCVNVGEDGLWKSKTYKKSRLCWNESGDGGDKETGDPLFCGVFHRNSDSASPKVARGRGRRGARADEGGDAVNADMCLF